MAEAEALLEAVAELAVEHAQHDRHLGPALAEPIAHRQAGLDVGEVVGGEDRHGGGARQVDRVERLDSVASPSTIGTPSARA